MIEIMKDLPDDALGVVAHGQITLDDYKGTIEPEMDRKLEQMDHLNFLYCFDDDYEGFDPEALLEDARLGKRHLKEMGKMAVVADDETIRAIVSAFKMFIPNEVKLYHRNELENAKDWITEA